MTMPILTIAYTANEMREMKFYNINVVRYIIFYK